MSNFFAPFPALNYDINKDGFGVEAVDIIKRYKVRDIIRKYTTIIYYYTIKDGEKPFIVADKYYGRPDLAELVLLTNNIIDPYYEWPLENNEFTAYIIKKYGSLSYASQNYHSYWQIIQEGQVFYDGTVVEERKLRIDATAYAALSASQRSRITYYDYELELNESRRDIVLIKREFISQIEDEMSKIFA